MSERPRTPALVSIVAWLLALTLWTVAFPQLVAEWQAPAGVVYGTVALLALSSAILLARVAQPDGRTARAAVVVVAIVVSSVALFETRRPVSRETFAQLFGGDLFVPSPYVMFTARPGLRRETPADPQSHGRESGSLSVNSEGYRGAEFPGVPKPQGQLRVAVLGGSSVFFGLTDERTVPAYLASALHRRTGAEVIAINGGILGGNSTQELVLLQTRILDLAPDVVVVLDGFNDVNGPLNYDPRVGYPYNFMVSEAAWRSYTSTDSAPVRLLESSRLLRRIREIMAGAPPSVDGFQLGTPLDAASLEGLAVRSSDLHWSNWAKMAGLCEAAGIDCLFALQPVLIAGTAPSADSPAARGIRQFFADSARRLLTAPRSARIGHLDLTALFARDSEPAFIDAVHVFDEANARLAEHLATIACRDVASMRGRCR